MILTGLQITMNDSILQNFWLVVVLQPNKKLYLVAIVDGAKNHSEKATCFFFFDSLVRDNVVKEFSARGVLHHNVDVISRFNYIVQTNDVWMMK